MDTNNRYCTIELLLQWQGELTSTELAKVLSISQDTAKRAIQEFNRTYPQATRYNKQLKCYQPTDNFKPVLSKCTLHDYLALNGNAHFFSYPMQNAPDSMQTHIYCVSVPERNLKPLLIRKIIKACKKQLRIMVEYLSLTEDEFEARIIQPHTLVYDGLRWHVRGYCEKNRRYQDFNLARFQGEIDYEGEQFKTKIDDENWNNSVDVVICPDHRLSPKQRHCIEQEYQMSNGSLVIPCKPALVNYLLLQLRIDYYKNSAVAQQVVLDEKCRQLLKPYLWNS